MSDQTIKADDGKLRLTLVPTELIRAVARIRMYGNAKYPEGGPDNWKKVEPERYRDALFRHLLAYLDDPDSVDNESGLPHRWHLETNLAFLAELEELHGDIHNNSDVGHPADVNVCTYYRSDNTGKVPEGGKR